MGKCYGWIIIIICLFSGYVAGQSCRVELTSRKPEIICTLKHPKQDIRGKLYVGSEIGAEQPAVLTNLQLSDNELIVTPRYELSFGQDYSFVISIGQLQDTFQFTMPEELETDLPPLVVDECFPLDYTNTLPAGNMFFYFRFNTNMNGDLMAYQHVDLLDEQGDVIPEVWRQKTYWIEGGKTMVLMIHPGKLKRGIKERMGVVLEPGHRYTIQLGEEIRDVNNRKITGKRDFAFTVTAGDTLVPEIKKINTKVKCGTKNPITISFTEYMDYGSLLTGITITEKETSNAIPVKITFNKSTMQCRLTPAGEWKKGTYTLKLLDTVADLSGNQLSRPFETLKAPESQNSVFKLVDFRVK